MSHSPQPVGAGAPSRSPGSRLGSIAGIPVHASWTLLLIAGLIALSVSNSLLPATVPGLGSGVRAALGLASAAAFIGSILVHELAHALVARRVGLPVQGITLWLFGGAAFLPEPPRKASHAFNIAIAGPLTSLGLGAVAFGFAAVLSGLGAPDALVAVFGWLALTNVVLGVFNMAPGLPLDGGRVVQALLWWKSGNRDKATVTAAKLGRIVGFALMGLGAVSVATGIGFGFWTIFMGWMLAGTARAEGAAAARSLAFAQVRVGDIMGAAPPLLSDHLTIAEFQAGLGSAKPYPAYPVQGFSGRIIGALVTDQLRRVPAAVQAQVRLRELIVPAEHLTWAQPGEMLADVFERARPTSRDLVLVGTPDAPRNDVGMAATQTVGVTQGLVGIITPDILSKLVSRAQHAPSPS